MNFRDNSHAFSDTIFVRIAVGLIFFTEGILKYTESQTIAIQRVLPLAPPPFIPVRVYASLMPRLLRLMRHIPGLR